MQISARTVIAAIGFFILFLLFLLPESASASRIAFVTDEKLHIINTDGSGLIHISAAGEGVSDIIWLSADKLVFQRASNLFLLDIAAKSKPVQLTFEGKAPADEDDDGIYCQSPVFDSVRNELYYTIYPGESAKFPVSGVSLNTRKPFHWSSVPLFINCFKGDCLYGSTARMPSDLVAYNVRLRKLVTLTRGTGTWGDSQCAISPDGSTIAFCRNLEIWLYNIKVRKARLLAQPGQRPRWSPDGKLILYYHTVVPPIPDNHPINKNMPVLRAGDPLLEQYGQIWVTDVTGKKTLLVDGNAYKDESRYIRCAGWTKEGQVIMLQEDGYRVAIKLVHPISKQITLLVEDGNSPVPCPF